NWRVLGQRRARIAVLAAPFAQLLHPLRLHQKKNNPPEHVVFSHQLHRQTDHPPLFRVVISHHRFFPLY
ncbi:hypothetical protein, partial [Enterobacter intestinihominis]